TIARPSACWNPKGIGRNPSTCSGWKGAFGWKRALRAGTVGIPFILNHSIRRIHSSVKHSFPYEVSLPCKASFLSALCASRKTRDLRLELNIETENGRNGETESWRQGVRIKNQEDTETFEDKETGRQGDLETRSKERWALSDFKFHIVNFRLQIAILRTVKKPHKVP
ncbi:hypothetical protein KAX97_13235, partial [candidate division WOR-3 bacterium]|nr:hypothetical protein [candidate division WOR-3 bacterium]